MKATINWQCANDLCLTRKWLKIAFFYRLLGLFTLSILVSCQSITNKKEKETIPNLDNAKGMEEMFTLDATDTLDLSPYFPHKVITCETEGQMIYRFDIKDTHFEYLRCAEDSLYFIVYLRYQDNQQACKVINLSGRAHTQYWLEDCNNDYFNEICFKDDRIDEVTIYVFDITKKMFIQNPKLKSKRYFEPVSSHRF